MNKYIIIFNLIDYTFQFFILKYYKKPQKQFTKTQKIQKKKLKKNSKKNFN